MKRQFIMAALVLACLPCMNAAAGADYALAGSVVNSVSGAPVPRAMITANCVGQSTGGAPSIARHSVLAGAGGTFRIAGLPAGSCAVSARRPGFEDWPGEMDVPETLTQIVIGPSREDLRIAMKPVTIIAGHVLDLNGDPVAGVLVQALRSTIDEGRRTPEVYAWATTDDRGYYRLSNLWHGPFYVRALGSAHGGSRYVLGPVLPGFGAGQSFAPTYFANASEFSSATKIPASPGEETRVDFTLNMQPAWRIRGVASGYAPGQALAMQLLRGNEDFATGRALENLNSGEFEIHDIIPGSYLLRLTQGGAAAEKRRAELPVQVSAADVTGLRADLTPGVNVVFRVHSPEEGQQTAEQVLAMAEAPSEIANRPRLPVGARISLRSEMDQSQVLPTPGEDGEQRAEGVLADRYRLEIAAFGGYVSSIMCGPDDLTASRELDIAPGVAPSPIDVTIRNDGGVVEGNVTAGGKPLGRATAILVPADGGAARIAVTAASDEGHFRFDQVPPGAWVAYAWDSGAEVEYASPSALQAAGLRGVSVNVQPDSNQTIQVIGWKP